MWHVQPNVHYANIENDDWFYIGYFTQFRILLCSFRTQHIITKLCNCDFQRIYHLFSSVKFCGVFSYLHKPNYMQTLRLQAIKLLTKWEIIDVSFLIPVKNNLSCKYLQVSRSRTHLSRCHDGMMIGWDCTVQHSGIRFNF